MAEHIPFFPQPEATPTSGILPALTTRQPLTPTSCRPVSAKTIYGGNPFRFCSPTEKCKCWCVVISSDQYRWKSALTGQPTRESFILIINLSVSWVSEFWSWAVLTRRLGVEYDKGWAWGTQPNELRSEEGRIAAKGKRANIRRGVSYTVCTLSAHWE